MRGRIIVAAMLTAGCAAVPLSSASADILINGTRVHPESITSDAAGNIYIGSTGGTIYRAEAGQEVAEPWIAPDPQNGLTSVFGVFVDDARQLLWLCNNPPFGAGPPSPGARPSLKAFELATGALRSSHAFPGTDPAVCNDIAISASGTVFATDTSGGKIFALVPGNAALALFAADPSLVGIDGIAYAADGTMYINNVRQNTMQRIKVDRGAYAGATTLALSEPVNGPDGLRFVSGNRFLQAEGPGGRVTYVDIVGDAATITPVKTGLDSSPGVTFIGTTGYATEGKINYLFDPALRDQDPGPFVIRAFPLPGR